MKFAAVLSAGAAAASVAQVEDYIANQRCLEQYIRFSKPACVANGECFEPGSNGCTDMTQWQWPGHAAGVNPHPRNRVTKNGHDQQKTVWTYSGDVTQGEAMQIYARIGADGQRSATQVTAEGVLNTPVNMISFIANVLIDQPAQWFRPGHNNTNGCGQEQTWELPFGFEGNSTKALPKFQKNLKMMHEAGKTITMTMGSWCTSFPVLPTEEWSEESFGQFVDYFKEIREKTFGGFLDGIDFDWEGYCSQECLKGANACHCDWDDQICGTKTPEELAAGVKWTKPGSTAQYECWRMATKSTMQVMTGITYHMKQAGFVVTLVPMSTQVYSGEEDETGNQVMRNEMVKYRKQPYAGGKAISGATQVDLLDVADGVLLQWYSGFDAALCKNAPADSKACGCNNVPDKDYPNVLNLSNGLISSYWSINGSDGNMFPTTFPIRCAACSGTSGPNACSSPEEAWFKVCNENQTTCVDSHKAGLKNYSAHHNHTENWWVEGMGVNSKCPRSIDCPDWQYEQEQRYSRQMNLLGSIAKVMDLNKVSIGFEVLGIDVQVQMHAYVDPALPWTDVTPDQLHKEKIYYKDCHVNMTADNEAQEMRCAQPLLSQQWGPKFVAKDVVGLDSAVQAKFGKSLAGVGFFTLDGVIAVPHGEKARYWRPQLLELNDTWAHIPATNVPIPGPTPLPPQPSLGFCTKFAAKNACGPCNEESDCGMNQGSACWKAKDANCGAPAPGPAPGPASKPYFCMHSSPQNACGSCGTPADCGGSDWGLCWATKDAQCPAAFETTLLSAVNLVAPEKKLQLKKPKCDTKFKCCREGSDAFCMDKAKLAFCDPKAAHTDRAVPAGEGCVCPFASKFDRKSKECKGSFGPTPTEFYCVHDAKKNHCGLCKTPEDCGGKSDDWDLCWASKDTACPKEAEQLVI